MADVVLNILTLGIKPLYERNMRFHKIIAEFRNEVSRSHKIGLTEVEIDEFYNKLDNFDFRFILFSNYYKRYIDNINRFKPEEEDKDLDYAFLKIAVAPDKWKPTKPLPVFIYHIQYKYKLTSKFFISYQKRQNLKKLNTPGTLAKQNCKTKSEQKWTRVPINRPKS
jgi:hypothetical protein